MDFYYIPLFPLTCWYIHLFTCISSSQTTPSCSAIQCFLIKTHLWTLKVQGEREKKKSKGTIRKEKQLSHGLTVSFLFKLGANLGVFKTFFSGRTSLVTQTVKRLPTMRETQVWYLSWEDPLEKEMATHSSTFAWKIPWMEEPDRLQSMGSQRVR